VRGRGKFFFNEVLIQNGETSGLLLGEEIKFIRAMLDLSQKSLAGLLGLNYQSILSYEKNKSAISKTVDHLLRAIFFAYLNTGKSRVIYDKINEIADIDARAVKQSKIEFEKVSDEWRKAA
jgi:transcriptional regulator with XRE-family HTH domain